MPVIKCPVCRQRILHPSVTTACTNCGTVLTPWVEEQQEQSEKQANEAASTPSQPLVLSSAEPEAIRCPQCNHMTFENETNCSHCNALLTPSESMPSATTSPELPALVPQQQLVPVQPPRAVMLTPSDPYLQPVYPAQPPQTINVGPTSMAPFVPGLPIGKLPWGFPKRPADADGVIIYVHAQEEYQQPSLLGAILRMFVNMVWATPGDLRQHEREKIHVTTIRVRMPDNVQKDARMEGYLKGANLSLGDVVSLWGWRRKGSLVVTRGYNHTAKATISSSTMSSPISGVVLILLAVVAFVLLAYMYHIPIIPHWP